MSKLLTRGILSQRIFSNSFAKVIAFNYNGIETYISFNYNSIETLVETDV